MRRLLLSTMLLFLFSNLLFADRYYDATTGRFLQIDTHAFKYPSLSPYSYVANNPLNSIDPDGRDVVVLNDEGAVFGAGHNAVVVGNDDDGWTYYSYEGDGEYTTETFDTYSDFGKSNVAKRYNRSVRFSTTKKQDNKAKKQGKKETKVKRGSLIQVVTDNCAHLVQRTVKKAGVILPERTLPNNQLDDAKKEKEKRDAAKKKAEERKKQEEQKEKDKKSN